MRSAGLLEGGYPPRYRGRHADDQGGAALRVRGQGEAERLSALRTHLRRVQPVVRRLGDRARRHQGETRQRRSDAYPAEEAEQAGREAIVDHRMTLNPEPLAGSGFFFRSLLRLAPNIFLENPLTRQKRCATIK